MSEKLTGDYRKFSDKKYLYHWDLPEDEDLIVTIDYISYEKLENKRRGLPSRSWCSTSSRT